MRLTNEEKKIITEFWESDLEIEIDRYGYILVLITDAYYSDYQGSGVRYWKGKRGLNIYNKSKNESVYFIDCDNGFQSPEEAIAYLESLSQEEISEIYNREYEEQFM